MTATHDPVRSFLSRTGRPAHTVDRGLDSLQSRWSALASACERKERWVWEEWLNDLSVRQIVEEVFRHVPEAAEFAGAVGEVDRRVAASTTASARCVWGETAPKRRGWTRAREWWYWRHPPTPYLTPEERGPYCVVATFDPPLTLELDDDRIEVIERGDS